MNSKRYVVEWLPGGHNHHEDCSCDLKVSFPSLGLEDIIETRFIRGMRRTIFDIYASVKARVVCNYEISNSVIGPRRLTTEQFDNIYVDVMREFLTPRSQIGVAPPIRASNKLVEEHIVPSTRWRHIFEATEKEYWNRIGIHVAPDEVKMINGKAFIPSLQSLVMKRMSWTDTVFNTYNGHRRVVHTMNNITMTKMLKLYGEFNCDTGSITARERSLWNYVPKALDMLESVMDIRQNYGRITPRYDPHMLIRKVKLFSSGGIMPGVQAVGTMYGEKVTVKTSGAKVYLVESAMRQVHDLMLAVKRKDRVRMARAIIAIIKGKYEFKEGQWKSSPELEKMLLKMREFFIPDLPHCYISILLNDDRMKLERNNVIKIGMKWWYGGAYEIYKYLNGDLPNMCYVTGDITGLDKHIHFFLLLLYCHGLHPYIRWAGMTEEEKEFWEDLMTVWATNVAAKLVCHIGGFWRYMVGQMYSGGKETSHGDSWIMAFIFYCFCQYLIEKHPSRAHLINEFMSLTIIAIIVYGDDHVYCFPSILADIMNHKEWAFFLKEYCNMELRDGCTFDSLLSIPDGYGRFKVRGPCFLKRYFIRNTKDKNLAPILPYKEIDTTMVKLFTTEAIASAEVLLSAVGHAWDTQGTNYSAYQAVLGVFNSIRAYDNRPILTVYKEYLADPNHDRKKIVKLMRKVGISESEVFDHFPTMSEMRARHVYDPEKCNYSIPFEKLNEDTTAYEWDVVSDDEVDPDD